MRYYIALISLVAGWSSAVVAQDAATVEDLTASCYWLAHAQTGRDVDYVPGEDVHGRAVVSADLNAPAIAAPEFYEFDLMVDLADDLPSGSQPLVVEQQIARIRVETRTGALWIDGTRYTGQSNVDLAAHCGEAAESSRSIRLNPAQSPIEDMPE